MFHLFLLLLYIANSILVFFVFSRFTKPSIAFLLSLLFLIHPANQEIAAYIADIQDVLYFFFGVSAILVITSKIADTKQLFLSSLLLLLACISKETGVLFIFAASVYLFLTKSPQLRRYMITYGVLLFGYFLVRFYAGQTAFLTITIPSHSTIQDLSLHSHILLIPKILAYYITAIIMPLPALPTEYLTTADPLTSILSFLFICLVYSGMVFVGKIIKRRNKKAFTLYIFFFSFFLVSSLFHSQIIPLDVLVSKRWLYVQLFTFLAMICIVLDVYFVKIKKYKLLFLLFFTAYAGILLTETFIAMTFY
jgi:hypothetical protein